MKNIPYGRQTIDSNDIEAVVSILKSDFLTQGPAVPKFEDEVKRYCGAKFAVAVNSATSALHIACLALGVGKGDIVWTSPITFVASANCALYCGAEVDFVDIHPDTYNICVKSLEKKLFHAKKNGCLPKVLIPVHMAGQSCDMTSIYELSQKYNFRIIEDASHAIGGRYNGQPIGCCSYSDITVFSFHPVKIITTGEGGCATTNNPDLASAMQLFRSHGITNELSRMSKYPENELWGYQQIDLGYNYRMTDIQAALGLSQMSKLDDQVKKRHIIAMNYESLLVNFPISKPLINPGCRTAYHLYIVRLHLKEIKVSQRQIHEYMKNFGVSVNLHYIPVYRQPYFEKMGFVAGYCSEAESYFSDAITLPLYPGLTYEQQEYVVSTLSEALS